MRLIIEDANKYIEENYGIKGYYPQSIQVSGLEHAASLNIYQRYKMIGYYSDDLSLADINTASGDKIIAKKGDDFHKEGEIIYRYIGYDAVGRLLYNPEFPPDSLGSSPDNSGLVKWNSSMNKTWAGLLAKIEKRELISRVMGNFKKSLSNTVVRMIDSYFLYHKADFTKTDSYYRTWQKFYEELFSGNILPYVDVVLLPTNNANGLAVFQFKSGYYSAIYLSYQDDTNAALHIRHIIVEGDEKSGYRVINGFQALDGEIYTRQIKSGKKISVKAISSNYYKCVGHTFHANLDKKFRVPGKREKIGSISSADEFNFVYNYDFNNDSPYLVFYYKAQPFEKKTMIGEIIVSSDTYDVSRAVPTDEKVDIAAHIAEKYNYNIAWGKSVDIIDIPVILKGTENEGIKFLSKELEYYKLHYCDVYSLNRVIVNNGKLDAKSPIVLSAPPSPKSTARVYSQNIMNISLAVNQIRIGTSAFRIDVKKSLRGGDSEEASYSWRLELSPVSSKDVPYVSDDDFQRALDYIDTNIEVMVRNDFLSIGGHILSKDGIFIGKAPLPADSLPSSPLILNKPEHMIENTVINGNSITTGKMIYERELGSGDEFISFDIGGNNVFVHTPTLNDLKMQDVSQFDQRKETKKGEDAKAYEPIKALSLPLDHATGLSLNSYGSHIKERGYGIRDYQKHLKAKVIRVPFDAYISKYEHNITASKPDKSFFVSEDSLVELAPDVKKVYIKAAPWVTEGLYKIKTYHIAENAKSLISAEGHANLDCVHDAAEAEIPVIVSGRLFDFTVEKVLDPSYKSPLKSNYWTSGRCTKDGIVRKRYLAKSDEEVIKGILPVMSAKSAYKNKIRSNIKLGYPIVFSVKSMGTYFNKDDVIFLKPKFYHILEDGTWDDKIALFYKKDGKLIRLGSEADDMRNYAVFKSFAGRDNADLIKSTQKMYALRKFASSYTAVGEAVYAAQISKPIFISSPSYALMSFGTRIFIGDTENTPSSVSSATSGMSVQKWLGSYNLPVTTQVYRLNAEGEADMTNRILSGSIGLAFDISLSRIGDESSCELAYVTEAYNGWEREGYDGGQGYPLGLVALYEIDKSRDDDMLLK